MTLWTALWRHFFRTPAVAHLEDQLGWPGRQVCVATGLLSPPRSWPWREDVGPTRMMGPSGLGTMKVGPLPAQNRCFPLTKRKKGGRFEVDAAPSGTNQDDRRSPTAVYTD